MERRHKSKGRHKMKNKTFKKIIAPVVLIVLLGILIAGTVLLKHYNALEKDSDGDGETQSIVVIDKTGKTVTAVSLSAGGETLSFTYENEVWVYDGDKNFPVDQDDLSKVASQLTRIDAVAAVNMDDMADNSEYGLDSPAVTAKASFSDGTEYTYSFGATNVFNDCQYFTVTGDSAIYMTETSVATALAGDLNSYYKAETFALTADGVTGDNVTSITVAAGGQENTVTDKVGCEELLDLVKVMNLTAWEDYYADSEEMKNTYGIEDGKALVTVNYTVSSTATNDSGDTVNADVPASLTLRIGNKFDSVDGEDGKYTGYFYSPVGSTVVYAADSETVDSIYKYLTYSPRETTDTTAAE